jgi:hypothetical protein
MNVTMQKAAASDQLQSCVHSIGFHGDTVDDRGRAAVTYVNNKAATAVRLRYNPEALEVKIGEDAVSVDAFPEALSKFLSGRVILEATTLGFVEILLCCRALRALGVRVFDLLYVEPKRYRSPFGRHLLHRRDFELSGDVPGYQAVPGSAILLGDRKPQRGIFFVGYEEARLRRAFEDLQMISPSKASVAFGVPAFKPGWEMDSIANNIDVIREQNIRGGVHFCGAENPAAVIEILSEIHESLPDEQRLFIAPIGTKPHGIGVALFVSSHSDVGIIYDHPRRAAERTKEIAHWHLFSVQDDTA